MYALMGGFVAGLAGLLLLLVAVLAWPLNSAKWPSAQGVALETRDVEPIQPLPLLAPKHSDQVAIGRRLFHDPNLSSNGQVACASCHDLLQAGTDGRRVSLGVEDRPGRRNAPSVFNAAFNVRQMWDGRFLTLEEQVSGPLQDPDEMASSWPKVLAYVTQDADYVSAFAQAYAGEVSVRTITHAIAEFERSLVTPSRFDRWLDGDALALDAREVAGYQRFKSLGCAACHQGVNVGGNLFERFGVAGVPADSPVSRTDQGRAKVTGRLEDVGVFKVPSLRNVVFTAPYFHDGSVDSLPEAIALMGRAQLGKELSDEDVLLLTYFLNSLTWEAQW